MKTYYFVAYESVPKSGEPILSSVILEEVHPLLWAANPPTTYAAHFFTRILFWAEIPESVALNANVAKIYGLERLPRSAPQ